MLTKESKEAESLLQLVGYYNAEMQRKLNKKVRLNKSSMLAFDLDS